MEPDLKKRKMEEEELTGLNPQQDLDSSSDDCTKTCGNCNAEVNEVHLCYGCRYEYCKECEYNGGCGVCDAEEDAFEKYDEAWTKIETMKRNVPEEITNYLKMLLGAMGEWKRKVEEMEDEIKCWSDETVQDGADIMTDCGDSVRNEMDWYLKKANSITKGESTFHWEKGND